MIRKIAHIPLIILISVFLTLDFTLLFLNISLTRELEHNALIINITGRQRMLSQRIAKDILTYNNNQFSDNSNEFSDVSHIEESLKDSADLFHQTLNSLRLGGTVTAADGEMLTVDPLTDEQSQALLKETATLWDPIYSQLQFDTTTEGAAVIRELIHFSVTGNGKILELMNALSIHSEEQSNENATLLREAQIIIFLLALLNFLIIVIRLIRANKHNKEFLGQLENMVKNLPQAVFFIDSSNRILFTNAVAEKQFSRTQKEFQGASIHNYLPEPIKNGTVRLQGQHLEVSISSIMMVPNEIKLISLLDVTESRLLKKKSLYDPLTGLLNRNGLVEAYDKLQEETDTLICLFLDLDRFKEVNDEYGHTTGDEVLSVIAKRLRSCLKQQDIVSRFGGDEFVIVLSSVPTDEELQKLYRRIKDAISENIDIKNTSINLGVSIGSHIGYTRDESLDVIIDDADKAMYADKERSRRKQASRDLPSSTTTLEN